MNDKPGYCDHDGTQVGMPCPFCGRLNMNPAPTPPKTHAEVADAIVERAKARGNGMVIVDREYEELENNITTALREAELAGAKRAGNVEMLCRLVESVGLVATGLPEGGFCIKAKPLHILDDAGNVRRVLEWSHNPLTNRIHAEIDVTQGEKP